MVVRTADGRMGTIEQPLSSWTHMDNRLSGSVDTPLTGGTHMSSTIASMLTRLATTVDFVVLAPSNSAVPTVPRVIGGSAMTPPGSTAYTPQGGPRLPPQGSGWRRKLIPSTWGHGMWLPWRNPAGMSWAACASSCWIGASRRCSIAYDHAGAEQLIDAAQICLDHSSAASCRVAIRSR